MLHRSITNLSPDREPDPIRSQDGNPERGHHQVPAEGGEGSLSVTGLDRKWIGSPFECRVAQFGTGRWL
eukprot:581848-Pyramimonas_sp.AAC.1